jgi:hypothetical protein
MKAVQSHPKRVRERLPIQVARVSDEGKLELPASGLGSGCKAALPILTTIECNRTPVAKLAIIEKMSAKTAMVYLIASVVV